MTEAILGSRNRTFLSQVSQSHVSLCAFHWHQKSCMLWVHYFKPCERWLGLAHSDAHHSPKPYGKTSLINLGWGKEQVGSGRRAGGSMERRCSQYLGADAPMGEAGPVSGKLGGSKYPGQGWMGGWEQHSLGDEVRGWCFQPHGCAANVYRCSRDHLNSFLDWVNLISI